MGFLFPEYHAPREPEFEALFDQGLVSVDANVLLNLYIYTPASRAKVLEVLSHFSDTGQLWLSHQAAEEYHRNRPERILSQRAEFADLRKVLEEHRVAVAEALKPHMRYEHTGVEAILKRVVAAYGKASSELETTQSAAPNWMDEDDVLKRLETLIGDRVTPQWSQAEMNDATAEAKRRLELDLPPGFKDKGKPEPACFGDYFIWRQMLQLATSMKRPLLFITDDDKDDWWWRVKGHTIGPRPELASEFRTATENPFYMYGTSRFVEWALRRLELPEEPATIAELQEVERASEIRSLRRGRVVWRREHAAVALATAQARFAEAQDAKSALDQQVAELQTEVRLMSREIAAADSAEERSAAIANLRVLEKARWDADVSADRANVELIAARAALEAAETDLTARAPEVEWYYADRPDSDASLWGGAWGDGVAVPPKWAETT